MSNILDLLLQTDISKIQIPTRKVKMKRLSEASGQEIIFTCEGIVDQNTLEYIKDASKKDGVENSSEYKSFTIIEGIKDPNLKNPDLLKKFGAINAKELLAQGKFLLPGEQHELYLIISELSGFTEDAVEEIKN